ncbi:MAG TPA: PepSY-associated TM helix domain-containing protein [Pedobacter sp.]
MKKKLRWAKHQKRWFGKWHLYLGIFAGVIVAFVGVTGSILTFREEIDHALNRQLFEVAPQQHRLPLAELISMVHKKHPELNYTYLSVPEKDHPSDTYALYNVKKDEQVFINPYNGEICGRRKTGTGFIAVVTELHTTLFIPVVGEYFVGLCALILTILTISGLRLWIPEKWKYLRQMLTVKFKGSFKRQNYDLHNVIGFYTSPVILILSLTGFLISFSILFIPLIFLLNGQSPQGVASLLNAQSALQKNTIQISPSQIIHIASVAMPDAEIRGIALPSNKKGSYRLDLVKNGFPSTGRRQMLSLDQYSGKVLLNSDHDFPEVGKAYLSWLSPLHYGSFGGLPTKIISLIAGLAPLGLCITGFIIWLPRWRKQRRHPKKRTEEPAAKIAIPVLSPGAYMLLHLKKGLKYGLWMLLIAACAGMLYGLIAGIFIQPALFTILFATLLITVNFLLAFILMLFNTIIFMPLKKGSRSVMRYFSWSFSIFMVFIITYTLINYSGLSIF